MGAGSSPLTRGARRFRRRRARPRGLIPAHAGSTRTRKHPLSREAAHPRSRGEHAVTLPGSRRHTGSSPLTRGARWVMRLCGRYLGLIPAHAGSTSGGVFLQYRFRAHPRSRGEHAPISIWVEPSFGSSPLTRGALSSLNRRRPCQGLIPAHAGSTLGHLEIIRVIWAHPRSRGEHRDSSGQE